MLARLIGPLAFVACSPLMAQQIEMPRVDPNFFVSQSWPRNAVVMVELFVSEKGKVLECEVLYSTEPEDRHEKLCSKTIGSQLGEPAKDAEGNPVHGVTVVTRVPSYRRNSVPDLGRSPDVEVVVQNLPGEEDRVTISLLAYFDESGRVRNCVKMPDADPTLSAIACQQSMAHQFPVRFGESGKPVSLVDWLAIDFIEGAGPAD